MPPKKIIPAWPTTPRDHLKPEGDERLVALEKCNELSQIVDGMSQPIQALFFNMSFMRDAVPRIAIIMSAYRNVLQSIDEAGISLVEFTQLQQMDEQEDTDFIIDELPRAVEDCFVELEKILEQLSAYCSKQGAGP